MSVYKYGFILDGEDCNPDNYSGSFSSDSFEVNVIGTSSLEMACKVAKDLVEKGIELIELCGAFDEEKSKAIKEAIDDKVEVGYVKYFGEEIDKINKLESFENYGFMVMVEDYDSNVHKLNLNSPSCKMKVVGVSDINEACKIAKDMVKNGIDFIELCSAFSEDETKKVIAAIEGKVPVGAVCY